LTIVRELSSEYVVLFFTLISIATPHPLLAQDSSNNFSRNAIYVEGLGQGVAYSVNYDYRIIRQVSIRAGFTFGSIPPPIRSFSDNSSFTGFPLMVNMIIGGKVHHLETGIGAVVGINSTHWRWELGPESYTSRERVLAGTATIAYRVQSDNGGLLMRMAFTPFFSFKEFVPFAGISLGYAF
jgi:hypothetical protein